MPQWGASPVGKTATALAARRVKQGLVAFRSSGLTHPTRRWKPSTPPASGTPTKVGSNRPERRHDVLGIQ